MRAAAACRSNALDSSRSAVKARVPAEAASGRPELSGPGGGDTSPERLEIVGEDEIPDDGPFQLRKSQATPSKAFYDAKRQPKLTYSFQGEPMDVRILVAKKQSDRVVRTIVQRDRQPGTEYTVRWNGRTDKGNTVGNDVYRFKVGPKAGAASTPARTPTSATTRTSSPFADSTATATASARAAGTRGRTCSRSAEPRSRRRAEDGSSGTRYHSAAGYYLVIDAKNTGRDHIYMHMRKADRPREGARVRTGERIGFVSDTGNASGCHLHFEIWSRPAGTRAAAPPTPPTTCGPGIAGARRGGLRRRRGARS